MKITGLRKVGFLQGGRRGASRPECSILKSLGALLLLIVLPITAQGETTARYFSGAELGYSTYEFDQKIDQTLVFTTLGLTAGVSYGRYSFLANYAFSFDEADVSEEDFIGTADRTDLDLILAYQINSEFSVFAGYKNGETELESISREDENGPTRDESFKQDGLFVGASYTWAFKEAGRLSLSLAYADLDADNEFVSDGDGADPGEAPEFDDITGKTSGSSTGYSLNLTYSLPLQGNWLYRTKLRINRYEQDIDFEGTTFSGIDENSTSLLMGLVYIF